jgi:hypothetical protein
MLLPSPRNLALQRKQRAATFDYCAGDFASGISVRSAQLLEAVRESGSKRASPLLFIH